MDQGKQRLFPSNKQRNKTNVFERLWGSTAATRKSNMKKNVYIVNEK